MIPTKESSEYENSMYEQRRAEINRLPPGPQKDKELADLSRDYEGRGALATDKLATAQSDFSSAMDPLAMTKGPSGNPFAVDVGPGIAAHVGRGMNMYNANKRRKGAEADLEGLSAGKESATKKLIGSMSEEEKRQQRKKALADGLRNFMY